MNRNWHRRAAGGLPILSAALLSAAGLLWDGASSGAIAQTYSGASSNVIVNYDALNALPGQQAPVQNGPAQNGYAGVPPQPQFAPGYPPAPGMHAAAPRYAPYGAIQPRMPYAAPYPPAMSPVFAAPPPGVPTSVITTIGRDGRPIAPIQLKQPGSEPQGADSRMAAVTPPSAPIEVPESVPMPEATPPAPAPGVNAGQPPAEPAAEIPEAPESAEAPEPEAPAPEETAAEPIEAAAVEQPAEEQPTEQAAQEPPAETPAGEEAAESDAAAEAEEEPAEEAAAEAPAEPDNSQPAPPIPQGGIRIVFPVDLNDVPVEANAALDDLAAQMQADEAMRIQIKCYASGNEETESKARRKSLQRCINIRQYLFKKDVRTTRMDVRALGLKSEGQPADRVDIVPANS